MVPIQGVQTEVVLVAGKMGKAYGYRADNGQRLWTLSLGKHQNDTGLLTRKPVTIFPGDFGGVETPMALAGGRLFVPWLDYPAHASSTGLAGRAANFRSGRGGLTAVDAATGKVLWQRKLPSMGFGRATVANDVVFTSTYAGTIYAFAAKLAVTFKKKGKYPYLLHRARTCPRRHEGRLHGSLRGERHRWAPRRRSPLRPARTCGRPLPCRTSGCPSA